MSLQYAPLEQLAIDLQNNTAANYNWITPNQFNDMHTGLSGSFTYNGTTYLNNASQSGAEKIAQGDNFLGQILTICSRCRSPTPARRRRPDRSISSSTVSARTRASSTRAA
jgi:hypothetical protein